MDRSERKRFTRKNLTLKNKKDRFISTYVETKYPQIYEEAKKCYDQIDVVYPNKRDLTKTVEYLYISAGVTSLNQYYHKRREEKVKNMLEKEHGIDDNMVREHGINDNMVKEHRINDNMVLKIPLFDAKDSNKPGTSSHQQQEPLPIPDDLYQTLLQELRNDPELYSIFNDMDMSGGDSIDLSEEQLSVTSEQPDESIPDTLCEDIVHELCEDPQLRDILDDMDIGEYNEQTPLERELSGLNY